MNQRPDRDPGKYDVIVVGGGLAGMTSAVYLTDHGLRVLLLEKESDLGGLAASGALANGIRYDRGAAYWTDAYEEEQKILEHIGLGEFRKKYAIAEPIDSYFWNGKLYLGIWEEETLHELPASFALFKHELQAANAAGMIPNQPFEETPLHDLDTYSAADWIRQMPGRIALRTDEESHRIHARFLSDPKVNRVDPMGDVIGLMDLYCRSALGAKAREVSAVAFANFYISEIETRYTTDSGTGRAAEKLEKILRSRPQKARLLTDAPAARVISHPDSVEVTYVRQSRAYVARARYAVFAGQLRFAPRLIEGFARKEPERAAAMTGLDYSHYSVHVVSVKGHPYRATYDTWTRASDATDQDFTDLILGRWMDPAIHGYEGMRDFLKNPADEDGILSIYHPLSRDQVKDGYSEADARDLAHRSVDRMLEIFSPLLSQNWGTRIEVRSVETSRWPFSVHVARPGHFKLVKELRRPFGRVFFANNNLGTPSFEEALFRGHCAANNVLKRVRPRFRQETWTQCPLE